jgi:hypothetical protein
METFTEPRALVHNERYANDRRVALHALDLSAIDPPIVDLVEAFRPLTFSFTLQCCYGHFLPRAAQGDHSLAPLPGDHVGEVRYRIAYVALCIEESELGSMFLEKLSRVPEIEPAYVQFGCADWFWEQWPNSYTLQVEPTVHRFKDQVVLTAEEALRTQRVRDRFFEELRRLLTDEAVRASTGAGPT